MRDAEVLEEALGILLQRRFRSALYRRLVAGLDPALDATSYPVISGVARFGPLSAAALGAELGLDRSVVSRRASCLVDAGLLCRGVDEGDARASLLSLTQRGEQIVVELRRRLVIAIDERLSAWDHAERQVFASSFARFVEGGPL